MSLQSTVIRQIFQTSASMGLAYDQLCKLSGITREEMADSEVMVEWEKAALIWEPLMKLTDDPLIGLHIGMEVATLQNGMVGFLMQSSKNLDHALQTFCNYSRLVAPMVTFSYHKSSVATLAMEQNKVWLMRYPESARQAMDYTLAVSIRVARMLSGKKIIPLRVESMFERRNVSEYRRLWECDVVFGAATNKIILDKEAVAHPVLTSDTSLYQLFSSVAAQKIESLDTSVRIDAALKSVLFSQFKGQIPTIEEAAATLNLTPRSLQRRLLQEHTCFRTIANEVRRDIALQLMKNPKTKIGEVAQVLGYSELSAFRRAFKQWTKQTPRAHKMPAQS